MFPPREPRITCPWLCFQTSYLFALREMHHLRKQPSDCFRGGRICNVARRAQPVSLPLMH